MALLPALQSAAAGEPAQEPPRCTSGPCDRQALHPPRDCKWPTTQAGTGVTAWSQYPVLLSRWKSSRLRLDRESPVISGQLPTHMRDRPRISNSAEGIQSTQAVRSCSRNVSTGLDQGTSRTGARLGETMSATGDSNTNTALEERTGSRSPRAGCCRPGVHSDSPSWESWPSAPTPTECPGRPSCHRWRDGRLHR